MIAVVNVLVLVISTFLFAFLYIKSVGPAQLERKIGPRAYPRCARYRMVAMALMFVAMACFFVYYFYPLNLPIPRFFPWPRPISISAAVLISIPAAYIMIRGVKDAGEEALIPKKEHGMYGGIYLKIRHPQAWEAIFWFAFAFLLHSPFLFLFSFVGLFLEYWMVMAEEKDLVLRFGSSYEDYRRVTGAFLPRFIRKGAKR